MQHAAATAAGLALDVDERLDALEVRRQRPAVDLARRTGDPAEARASIPAFTRAIAVPSSSSPSSNWSSSSFSGRAPEAVALESGDDRVQPDDPGLDLGGGEPIGLRLRNGDGTGQPHDPVVDRGPAEPAVLEPP